MIDTPEVVIVTKYTPSYKNLNFKYSTKQSVYNSTMNMFDYYADIKKKAIYMFDYFEGKIGKEKETNIIFENGEYATKLQIDKRKKEYKKYIENSNIYKMVISFPEHYLRDNVDIKKFEKELAKEIIPMVLKKCGFQDIKKMSYQLSLHTNTDNYHFHLSFCEKEPNYKQGKELKYRFKGELTQEELEFFKNEILHYIEKEKIFTPLLKETNKELDELKKYFDKNDINYIINRNYLKLEESINRLGELLEEKDMIKNSKIKFNSIKDKEIIKLTKYIKKTLFEDDKLKDDYLLFKNSLNKINDYFETLSKSNHINHVDKTLTKEKKKYLNNYVYNAIINHIKDSKLTEEDILQEVVRKEYKNNKMDKYNMLLNLVRNINKTNTYKIKNAIKSVNDEMNEASKEFDELFKNEEYML